MSRFHSLDPADYRLPDGTLETLLSPALVIYLDKVRDNLQRLIACAGGNRDRLRPHLKTSKLPRVWARLVAAGLRNFKCATVREAACMLAVLDREASGEAADLLVAYPHVAPALTRLGELASRHPDTRLSVLAEDPDLVPHIPPRLGIFIDLNPGMNRTGVPMADTDTIARIAERAGPRFRGLHHYEGHIDRGTPSERRSRCFALYDALLALEQDLRRAGMASKEIITSGSPSFTAALAYEPFGALEGATHRVSPGTVVYFDARYEETMTEVDFVPAAMVLTRVVSHPTDRTVTVDAGSKALAAEAGDPCALVLGHPELVAQRPSEEHLPLTLQSGELPPRGTPLLLIPRHVCPTVNLAEEAVLIEGGEVVARAPVSARAH